MGRANVRPMTGSAQSGNLWVPRISLRSIRATTPLSSFREAETAGGISPPVRARHGAMTGSGATSLMIAGERRITDRPLFAAGRAISRTRLAAKC
jgi:hypothetical protein